jgi:uncharacterized membrane-anchored protein
MGVVYAQAPEPAAPAQAAAQSPEQSAAQSPEQPDPEQAVWLAAQLAMLHGPQQVALVDQAMLSLPEGYGFVPKKEAAAVMDLLGNPTDERFIGIVFPDTDAKWLASVDYEASGYIEDGDAKEWDADELLEGLQEGTKAGNEARRKMGITPIEVTKWVEVPNYDSPQHRLVWSAEVREIGGDNQDPTINYNTYVLGREGYISLNLITSGSQIDNDKPAARQLLAAIQFNEGKRYADFNKATDKVADFGLSGLVGGVDLQLGLLATALLLLAKFGKFILIGIAALAAILVRVFRARRQAA